MTKTSLFVLVTLVVWLTPCFAQQTDVGITADPINVQIPMSDLGVAAIEILTLPETQDASKPTATINDFVLRTNGARTRVQAMSPLGDGSGRIAISDLRGVLYIADADGSNLQVYLDLRSATSDLSMHLFPNEAGLLGFAFHPQFGEIGTAGYGKFYTGYSARADSGKADFLSDQAQSHHSVLREWTAQDHRADRFSGASREVLRVGQFAVSHNIGTLAFNPAAKPGTADFGALYLSFGDGGGAFDPMRNGQNPLTPLGTLLRINPLAEDGAYAIPQDNPFVGVDGYLPEIWLWGIRHAQHFSFAQDGQLFINDIGQNLIEEINIGRAGANYGWPLREGTFVTGQGRVGGYLAALYQNHDLTDGFTYPIAQYDHDDVVNAIGSGYLYEGAAIPALRGKYVFGDLVQGTVYYIDGNARDENGSAQIRELQLIIDGKIQPLRDVASYANTYTPDVPRVDLRLGVDSQGELYLLTKGDGKVRKLVQDQSN
ncbi:MAG: PQQ-dependent sugar dehydrogenase [Pseudomonadota bacterium]